MGLEEEGGRDLGVVDYIELLLIMEESAIHSDLEKICVLCNTDEEVEITLDCGHSYCLICMSYVTIKGQTNGNNESQVTCRAAGCNKVWGIGCVDMPAGDGLALGDKDDDFVETDPEHKHVGADVNNIR